MAYKGKSTRLRFISSKDKGLITAFIGKLPFKIEIKEIVKDKNKWFVWYNLADNSFDIGNRELD